MNNVLAILPSSSGEAERAFAVAVSDTLDIPYAELMNPYTAPVWFLRWLAVHHSVDLWYEDWPVERKREIIAHTMGISPLHPGERLPELKGTQAAGEAYLAYVDGVVIHKISFPYRRPVGRIAAGITPINHRPFVARWLVKVAMQPKASAVQVGKSAVGRSAVRTLDREPLTRAKKALAVSKAPETAYSVSFAYRVPITMDDGLDLDAGHVLGSFKNRTRL